MAEEESSQETLLNEERLEGDLDSEQKLIEEYVNSFSWNVYDDKKHPGYYKEVKKFELLKRTIGDSSAECLDYLLKNGQRGRNQLNDRLYKKVDDGLVTKQMLSYLIMKKSKKEKGVPKKKEKGVPKKKRLQGISQDHEEGAPS